jgi:hypothetical protein
MTDAELITDEIVNKARATVKYYQECTSLTNQEIMRQTILIIQDDIVRPYRNVFMGWKRDAIAYKKALEEITEEDMLGNGQVVSYHTGDECMKIAKEALKGEYHETDFTDFCKGSGKEMITTITEYQCDICKKKYKTQEKATECEIQGIAEPHFNIGDIVYIKVYAAYHYDKNKKEFPIHYTKDEILDIRQEENRNVYITKASYGWDERNQYSNQTKNLFDDYLCDYALSRELYDNPEIKLMTTIKPNEKYVIEDAIPNYNYDCWT